MRKEELLVCQCSSMEHLITIVYWDDDKPKEVYVNIHLAHESNIFKRIINAVKYIFGHKSKYGDFDEFILRKEDADKLQEVVNYLKSE